MVDCNVDKAAAKLAASFQGMGVPVDADALDALPLHGKAHFAEMTVRQDDAIAHDAASKNPSTPEAKAAKKLGPIGFVRGFATDNTHPTTVLGEHFMQPLLSALHEHQVTGGNAGEFKANVLPVIDEMRSTLQDHFQDPGKLNYGNRFLNFWEAGGKLYDLTKGKQENFKSFDPKAQEYIDSLHNKLDLVHEKNDMMKDVGNRVLYPVRTAAGNLVSFSPFIAGAHAIQFLPKSMGIYGLEATAKGIKDYALAFAKNGMHPIPELNSNHLVHETHGIGRLDPVPHADNLMSGISYFVGKHSGEDPMKAVQTLAYKDRLGDEPMIMWNSHNAQAVYLMRFALGFAKTYAGWYKNIVQGALKGDWEMARKGAYGLALFSAGQSVFTGVTSAIPAPAWAIMSPDQRAFFEELDQSTPFLNVVKHASGGAIALEHHFQPLGGMALGVGYDVVNTDVKSGGTHLLRSLQNLNDQDYTRAGLEFARGGISLGAPFVPGMNVSLRKVLDVTGDVMTGDLAPEDAPTALGQKFHLVPKE